MSKNLQEAIENVGMVNNVDGQNFDKDFVGTAPVSYADAVLRMRAKREQAKKGCEEHTKIAMETLKKEISNAEHPEPLDKIKVSDDGKITLNESLFESFEDEHIGKVELKEWMPSHAVWVKKEGRWKPYSALDFDTLSKEEVAAFKGLGYDDVKLLPNDGSEPDDLDESVIRYPNGKEVTDIDLDKALDYQYGTDRDKDNSKYTDDEKQKAVDYWIKKTDTSPYNVSKEEVEPLEESKEDAKVFRVTYKHSPEVFSSVMVKATSEDEAKQKLAVKKPGKDIVGVSVMSDDEVNDMTNRGMSLMEAKVVDDFSSYEPWDAAVSTFEAIQNAGKMDALEQLIDDMYPDGIDRTELNDLLAYESDWVYSMLTMPSEEEAYDEAEPAVNFDEEEVVDEA